MVIIWYPAHIPVLTKIEDELQKKPRNLEDDFPFRCVLVSASHGAIQLNSVG